MSKLAVFILGVMVGEFVMLMAVSLFRGGD